jgi:hypothetical protein
LLAFLSNPRTATFGNVLDCKCGDLLVGNDYFFYLEFVKALFVFDIALVGRNPNERGSIELSTNAPIEASSFE